MNPFKVDLTQMDLTQIIIGFGIAIGLHAIALFLMLLSFFFLPGKTPLLFFLGIGIYQVVYMLPMGLYLKRKGQRERLLGLEWFCILTVGLNILYYAAMKYQ